MIEGIIKKEQEVVNGKMYYKVMLKRNSMLSRWYEEFGSFDKDKCDDMFYKISKAKNIEVECKL